MVSRDQMTDYFNDVDNRQTPDDEIGTVTDDLRTKKDLFNFLSRQNKIEKGNIHIKY